MAGPGAGIEEAEAALKRAEGAADRMDVDGMVAHLSTAVREFTASGDPCKAAMACARLGDVLANAMGNLTAGRAWFARARRLVEDQPDCLEQGWVAIAAMGCDVDDPDELLAAAELALDRARRFGDVNLETKALADAGLAHVQAGRIAHGMALLDEAMALACGPADDVDTATKSVCSFFTACYFATDFARASSWEDLLRRRGLISALAPGPAFLSSHCDTVRAALLVELGRWSEAETVLEAAKAAFESTLGMPAWHPDIGLADLRIRQGRHAEADTLLLGKDQSVEALLPAVRLHLARGELDLARAAVRRGLRVLGADRLRSTELLALRIEIELARGDLGAAEAAGRLLDERLHDLDVPGLRVRAVAAQAGLLAAGGDGHGAVRVLEEALDRLDPTRVPWCRVSALLALAAIREAMGDTDGARADALAAQILMADLDVVLTPDRAALLTRLAGAAGTVHGRPGGGTRTAVLTERDGWWSVTFDGARLRLRATKGLSYAAMLVTRPGVERHVFDLVDQAEGTTPGTVDRRALGDAGPALDSQARATYRRRIEELRASADDAMAIGALERAEAAQAEIDALVSHLAAAYGLGGRDRRAASAAERARLNVTRALRTAIMRVTEELPEAGAALDRGVRTGMWCAYEPRDEERIRWTTGPRPSGT
jgi:tetratricopeptide (TPR) repeat protein